MGKKLTTILNEPNNFAKTALSGFADAFGRHVRLVSDGVVRRAEKPTGHVALIVGGGSGHYPAFAGYVGEGMADAAVAGDVFASPSAAAIVRLVRAADRGGGVILGFGNYAGDVLNFGIAAERLRAQGIDVRIMAVTDDIASADAIDRDKRRGIAGDLIVFKIVGAAAECGLDIDDVERIARLANSNTFSFGVAFNGCTLPGADAPLFSIPKGEMALGLGIHGEAGIRNTAITSARDFAKLMVERILWEKPPGASRAGVVLNGLGASKYEELFVLWTEIALNLEQSGISIVNPLVGEFVTSLDMKGCSLSVVWLDCELEGYWNASCDAPVLYRPATPYFRHRLLEFVTEKPDEELPSSTESSRASAKCIVKILARIAEALHQAEQELGLLDARAGDGDHGQGMARGSSAAAASAASVAGRGGGAASVLAFGGDAWADRAGGTSGVLWGLLLRCWSRAFTDNGPVTSQHVVEGARLALEAIMNLGGAKPGDKTLVDAFEPFVRTLEMNTTIGKRQSEAWEAAAKAATEAARSTEVLIPRLGRARPLAERSLGYPDAGATSLALVARVVTKVLEDLVVAG